VPKNWQTFCAINCHSATNEARAGRVSEEKNDDQHANEEINKTAEKAEENMAH